MNTPPGIPDPDAELDARLRTALEHSASRPPPAVRRAILDEARRIAEAAPSRRPAANDGHWRAPAVAAVVALIAVLVALPLREPAPVTEPEPPGSLSAAAGSQREGALAGRADEAAAKHVPTSTAQPSVERKDAAPRALVASSPRQPASPAVDRAMAQSTPAAGHVAAYAERTPPEPLRSAPAASLPSEAPAAGGAADARVAAASPAVARAAAPAPMGGPLEMLASDGRSALLRAVEAKDTGAVRRLLAAGADPNLADAQGVTPLALAERLNAGEISRLLRASGAR